MRELDHVAEVRATLAMLELERRRARIVMVATAGRRTTGARRELEAPALLVNGRLATAGPEWLTALESSERDHEAGR